METVRTPQLLGLELPDPVYIFGAILFGILGFVAYRHGRKCHKGLTMWLGVALMDYPYAVSGTGMLYAVGVVLCAGIYLDQRG